MFGKACQFNGDNGHVMEVASSMEGEWSYRGGQFNGVRMVMLRKWTVIEGAWNATEVANLKEGEWSCYRGGQFKGGRMVMLQRWAV